jgi:hypothetical protein
VDPNDQKKTACYDIDVEVEDPLKSQMSSFLLSTANQQEIASLLAPWREQEQRRLAQALQRAAEEWQLQKKELLERCEAGLQQALGEREERWRGQLAEGQQAQRRQAREGLLAELDASLAELRKQPHGGTVKPWAGETGGTVAQIIASSYRDLTAKALGQAKKEWDKVSLSVQWQEWWPSVTSVNNYTRRGVCRVRSKGQGVVTPGQPCRKGYFTGEI